MKKHLFLFHIGLIMAVLFSGCITNTNMDLNNNGKDIHKTDMENQGMHSGNLNIANGPIQELSSDDIEGLKYMREEEKLARDVYITLYDKWGLQIFKNIEKSEETHMAAVKSLLDKYNITDPVKNDNVGEFSNPELRELYNRLVEEGDKSLIDGLKVGATVEEVDIVDLKKYIDKTNNGDIKSIYNNLMKGSRNHLRAFVSTLEKYGVNYTPQYLSNDEYDQIISTR